MQLILKKIKDLRNWDFNIECDIPPPLHCSDLDHTSGQYAGRKLREGLTACAAGLCPSVYISILGNFPQKLVNTC